MRHSVTAARRLGQIQRSLRVTPSPPPISASLATMSPPFKQEPHKLLLIPGPIEVSDEVLFANAHPSMSHVSPDFIPVFGDCIRMLREVLFTTDGQPILIAGSGTLGWDQVASNLVEAGEDVLVLNSGYFGDSFAACLETYGAKVTELKAPIGAAPTPAEVEAVLQSRNFKLITITHVDTSTGVLSDAKGICEIVKRVSPDTLIILDGVCSVASEEIRFDEWGLYFVLTATQKGLGTPPGLSVLCVSQKALKVFEARRSPPSSYYASWKRWLPIMKAYESGAAQYFATPPVNLIYAFNASLKAITKSAPSLEERFRMHKEASQKIKKALEALGLRQVPLDPSLAGIVITTAVLLLLLSIARCKPSDSFYQQFCGKNFTDDVNAVNIDNALFDLLAKTALYGYAESTFFAASPAAAAVYALSRCRGDLSATTCSECTVIAAQKIRTSCPQSAEARIWHEDCFLHYDTNNFFGVPDTSYTRVMGLGEAAKDWGAMNQAVRELILAAKTAAAADSGRRFGLGEKFVGGNTTLYGMAQCTIDLQEPACNQCLEEEVDRALTDCKGRTGCHVLSSSCEIRYETNMFMRLSTPKSEHNPTSPRDEDNSSKNDPTENDSSKDTPTENDSSRNDPTGNKR